MPRGSAKRCFPKKRRRGLELDSREVRINCGRVYGKDHPHRHYANNYTRTTKYNLLTFLPVALFEQYRRVANIYFTLVAALSLTPYSPVRPWTTFLPLGIVLGVSMIKEAVEDYKRYRQDNEVNNRKVQVFNPLKQEWEWCTWQDLAVGDIIAVHKDDFLPADLLFLSGENDEGICYVETMNLDGETNLKIKKCLDQTKDFMHGNVGSLNGMVRCEPPNYRLYTFTGNLELGPPFTRSHEVIPLSPATVLLRGCSLRNTARILGVVIYAGHDTKIFMNATQPPSKRSSIEKTIDKIIYFQFSLLLAMCIVGSVYFAHWTKDAGERAWYLMPSATEREFDPEQPVVVAFTNFITSFILYGYLIPISLYVSVEMVKIVQIFFIACDLDMYHEETDTPAMARTSNLNEELGMVNTVLSDKTGTLTRNVMEFFKCSIAGVPYGTGVTEIERVNALRKGIALQDTQSDDVGSYKERYFNFYDERLMDVRWATQPNTETIMHFFRLLAICHTVIPDGPADERLIKYEAESPDEAAFVVAAKVFGFFFYKRTNTTVTIRENLPDGVKDMEYEVLNILEFNSTRKRMSVIIRGPEGQIIIYCKGADTVIYERLDPNYALNEEMKEITGEHMEDYGSAGLRTLCLSWTEVDPVFYDAWQEEYVEAKISLEDREAKVEAVSEKIEKNLRLLGCTAIEDKLQEGVPECISTLAHAGIRLWVLTGDKMETAINIGYACSLISDEMVQFQVTATSHEIEELERNGRHEEAAHMAAVRVSSQLSMILRTMERGGEGTQYALIIDGKALSFALSQALSRRFLNVGLRCASVICCRVSPLQKAQVTALVKSHGDTTLAIGDGANDVGMIQKAHIGVGISGQEGMQAVMSSDFAIAQFRFLTPLLLVHGRYSYKRIARMVCFFFYKNLYFGCTIFAFNALTNFSGQPMYNDFYMTLFNVVFTALTPLVVGWFDRDVDKEYALRFPSLYKEGQQNLYFSLRAIVGWISVAMVHLAITLAMVLVGADPTLSDRKSGQTYTMWQTGALMFTIVIITIHLQFGLVLEQWTWMHHFSIWGSIAIWFLYLVSYGFFPINFSGDLYHLFIGVVANSYSFWLFIVVVPLACLLPTGFYYHFRRSIFPAQYQKVGALARREQALGQKDVQGLMHRAAKLAAKASRMVMVRRGKNKVHAGFVPPYETEGHPGPYPGLQSLDTSTLENSQLGIYMGPGTPGKDSKAAQYSSDGGGGYGAPATLDLPGVVRNPVLNNLDRELKRDPMRHRHTQSRDLKEEATLCGFPSAVRSWSKRTLQVISPSQSPMAGEGTIRSSRISPPQGGETPSCSMGTMHGRGGLPEGSGVDRAPPAPAPQSDPCTQGDASWPDTLHVSL